MHALKASSSLGLRKHITHILNVSAQEELASTDKIKKRDAVKKVRKNHVCFAVSLWRDVTHSYLAQVIRDMTLGKDVSGLFTAVVNCMMTPNRESASPAGPPLQ